MHAPIWGPLYAEELNTPALSALIERVNDPYSVYQLELGCGLGDEPQKTPQCAVVHRLDGRLLGRFPVSSSRAKAWLEAATKSIDMEPEIGATNIQWVIQHSKKSFSGSTPKASLLLLESELFRWGGE